MIPIGIILFFQNYLNFKKLKIMTRNPRIYIWKSHLIRGKEYIKKNRLINAYDELSKSIHLYGAYYNKSNHEAHFLIGLISNRCGLYKEAVSDLKLALSFNPKPGFSSFYELGEAYLSLQEYKLAVPYFSRALSIEPKNFTSLFNRGVCHYEYGGYKKAILDFNRANKIKIDYDTFYNRGLCFFKIRNYMSAISDFNLAINLGYKKGDIFVRRGVVKSRTKDYRNAIRDFIKALNSKDLENEDMAIAHLEQAWAYMRIGEYKKGLRSSDKGKIIMINSGVYKLMHLINKAYAYIKLSKFIDAQNALNQALKLKLENQQLAFLLMLKGLSNTLGGSYNEALKNFEEMFLKDSNILDKDEESIFDEVPEYMKNLIRISLNISLKSN